MARPFRTENIIDEKICKPTLKAYHIGFDQNKFRLQPLVDAIRRVIPEFSLGHYCGATIPLPDIVERLKEAAETVYLTDQYQRRGEFGELILHLLLRDFQNSIPLVSKIYFKDAYNVNIHGFDGVQITINNDEKKLWLGESKLYNSGPSGIKELSKDITKHVNADYIQKEFNLISRKLPVDIPEIDHWRNLMDRHQKLDTIFSSIVIPMVCTYSSSIFSRHSTECIDYFQEFNDECEKLHTDFQSKNSCKNVEIILMLLPVPNKDELNRELDIRLKFMQSI